MAKRSGAGEVNGFISVARKSRTETTGKTTSSRNESKERSHSNDLKEKKRIVVPDKRITSKKSTAEVLKSSDKQHSKVKVDVLKPKKPINASDPHVKEQKITSVFTKKTVAPKPPTPSKLKSGNDFRTESSVPRTNPVAGVSKRVVHKPRVPESIAQEAEKSKSQKANENVTRRPAAQSRSKPKSGGTELKTVKAGDIKIPSTQKERIKNKTENRSANYDKYHGQPQMTPRQKTWTKDEDEHSTKQKNKTETVVVDTSIKSTVDSNLQSGYNDAETGKTRDMPDYDEYEYEDDFEEYESDFEEDLSESGLSSDAVSNMSTVSESKNSRTPKGKGKEEKTKGEGEEEKKMDSGNYDLSRGLTYQEVLKKKQAERLKEAMIKENLEISSVTSKTTTDVSSGHKNLDRSLDSSAGDASKVKNLPGVAVSEEAKNNYIISQNEHGQAIANANNTKIRNLVPNSLVPELNEEMDDFALVKQQIEENVNELVLKSGLSWKDQNLEETLKLKEKKEKLSRGERLKNMIKLMVKDISLLKIQPVQSYELFMIRYGKSDRTQAEIQTPECVSQGTQTETFIKDSKWTQHPITYHRWSGKSLNQLATFMEDRKGFGCDNSESKWDWRSMINKPNFKREKLNKFILSAGEVMISLLEEEYPVSSHFNERKVDLAISNSHTLLNIDDYNFLRNRKVMTVKFSPVHPFRLLTLHEEIVQQESDSPNDRYYSRPIIAIWNALDPSKPVTLLAASSEVSSLCFDSADIKLIYAGLSDGTVCVWDLSECMYSHRTLKTMELEHVLRVPTYSSACIARDLGHSCRIVSIASIGFKEAIMDNSHIQAHVFTLDEEGKMVIWTAVRSETATHQYYLCGKGVPKLPRTELGKSLWGRLKLTASSSVNLQKLFTEITEIVLEFTCLAKSPGNEYSVLIGTNLGQVARYKLSGKQTSTMYYDDTDSFGSVLCIEPSPNNCELFLVGTCSGTVRLHNIVKHSPLMIFSIADTTQVKPILDVLWSSQKPGLFFVSDNDSNLHVWDLCKGDLYPQCTVPFKDMKLASASINSESNYMAIAIDSCVQIHTLKNNLLNQGSAEDGGDERKFLYYISLLDHKKA